MLARHYALRLLAILILLLFAAFFFGPIIWLLLAPTKTDSQIINQTPLAFGSFATFGHTFHDLTTYEGDLVLTWLKNSAIYSFGGTALAVLTAIPAGYGLALTHFVGRRALLAITLVVMIVPATALVLPLFLEANTVHLVGTVWSLILPFGFFPFGVYLAYIYFSTTIPKDLIGRRALTAPANGACSGGLPCRCDTDRGPRRLLLLRRELEQLLPAVCHDL